MKNREIIFSFLLLYFVIYSIDLYSEPAPKSHANSQIELEKILKKSADYCERLASSALFFVCIEKIEEEIFTFRTYGRRYPTITKKNVYIYDYQLIKKGEKIEEKRILLEENGKKRNEENATLKTERFQSKRSVFGPVGLLIKDWKKKYNYQIVKEESVDRKEAIVIEVTPKGILKEDRSYGKVWVDKKDFSILKIEVNPESIVNFEFFEKEALKYGASPDIYVSHYYGIEKSGIRFPSKIIFEEDYIFWGKLRRFKKSKTVITYDSYRFFIVEVEVKR